MGKNFNFVSLDRITSKIYRDLGLEEISEIDIIEWVGEALEGIGTINLDEEAVAFIEVNNYKAELPNGLTSIIQIAKDNQWEKEGIKKICPADIMLDTNAEEADEECSTCNPFSGSTEGYPIPLDCNGTPIVDYEVAYYRPYFDLQYEYYGWCHSNQYNRYTPIRLANHSFFNSLVCKEDDELYRASTDEYTINNGSIMTSFKEGSIAVSYTRTRVDNETGYPLVPDDYSVVSAITWYVTWKYMARMWYSGKQGYADKMKEAESQWQWYCKQASNIAFGPHGVDEFQNLMEQHYRMIPNRSSYYSFFGKLGRPDNTSWKDSSYRNNKFRGLR